MKKEMARQLNNDQLLGGRRQNLNPEPKINLNDANLKPPRFYASQGWTGGEGIWSWRSEASEVEGALRLLALGEAPGGTGTPFSMSVN